MTAVPTPTPTVARSTVAESGMAARATPNIPMKATRAATPSRGPMEPARTGPSGARIHAQHRDRAQEPGDGVAHPEVGLELAHDRPDQDDLRPERRADDHERGEEPPEPRRVRCVRRFRRARRHRRLAAATPLV